MSRRPRTARRADARASAKLGDARERLARLEPGGAPERPVEVESASVVEPRALALGCARCGEALRLEAHDAVHSERGALRRVHGRCKSCGAERDVWLRIAARLPS